MLFYIFYFGGVFFARGLKLTLFIIYWEVDKLVLIGVSLVLVEWLVFFREVFGVGGCGSDVVSLFLFHSVGRCWLLCLLRVFMSGRAG